MTTFDEKTHLTRLSETRKRKRRPLPFVVVAPAVAMLLGALVTLVILLLGVKQLEERAIQGAALASQVISETMAVRLSSVGDSHERRRLLEQLAPAGDSVAILLDAKGREVARAPRHLQVELPPGRQQGGEAHWAGEPAQYFRARIPDRFFRGPHLAGASELVVVTKVSPTALRRSSLLTSVLSFATLLLGAAGFVAWALARDVHADVLYLRGLIVGMAREKTVGTRPIPVRTIDQVGQLTASFNTLLERFRAAERAYRQDLTQASAFDKDRSAFLAALSHELRTPLNAILGFTDVLLSGVDGPLSPDARENLTIVRTSGEHLRSLIDDILALSALESGQFRLSREELDVTSVAHDVVTEARVTADQKGIFLDLAELSKGPMTAFADRRRLRQILQNLISNAVKFTTEGGVVVTVTREHGDIVVTISDTGPGIEADALEGIWTEFSQAGASLVQKQGTGLGLSITRRLVQMHGGTVQVESKVGEGSTFSITIPIDIRRRSSITDIVAVPDAPVIRESNT